MSRQDTQGLPHLHFLVTEGGVDQAGLFHKVPRFNDSRLAEIFTRELLSLTNSRHRRSPTKNT